MADDVAGHRLVAGGVGGVSEPGCVEQTEAEPLVDPVAGSVHSPAWVVAEWRRLGRPRDEMLNVAPRQVAAVADKHVRAFKAKFHYAILVADRSEAGRRPAAS